MSNYINPILLISINSFVVVESKKEKGKRKGEKKLLRNNVVRH